MNNQTKNIAWLIALLMFFLPAEAKIIGTFPDDYFKAPILRVDDQLIFVMDRGQLKGHIYDRKTLEKVAVFGGKGQGPAEFQGVSSMELDDKYIYISSFPKLSIFSKHGRFVKEFRVPPKTGGFAPLGNGNYFATKNAFVNPREPLRGKLQHQVFDKNLKLVKVFFTSEFHVFAQFLNGKQYVYYFPDCLDTVVYKNEIYIGNSGEGFHIDVFSQNGDEIRVIKQDVKTRILTGEQKRKIHELYCSNETPGNYSAKREIVIKDKIPAYKAIFIDDDKIYVFTYPSKGIYDIYIMDLKGNLIEKKQMPATKIYDVSSKVFCMSRGILYFVGSSGGIFNDVTEFHGVEILGK